MTTRKQSGGVPASAGRGQRRLALVGCLALFSLVFMGFVRPWYLRWGATDAELRQVLPGDEIVPGRAMQETRAITIHAPIIRVWPWLSQLGQDRGGFYSFDLLENLVGCRMPTTDVLRPDRQNWKLGDQLWMYPREKAAGAGFATLRAYVPGRALAFGTRMTGTSLELPENGSWAMALVPIDASTTRLLVRGRGTAGRSLLGIVFDQAAFEPMHFVMERRMMIGLGQLAEGRDRGRLANHVHVVLWTVTFVLFIAAFAGVLTRPRWGRSLLAFVAAALVFQVLTFVQPPLVLGLAMIVALAALLWGWPTVSPRLRTTASERPQTLAIHPAPAETG